MSYCHDPPSAAFASTEVETLRVTLSNLHFLPALLWRPQGLLSPAPAQSAAGGPQPLACSKCRSQYKLADAAWAR